MPWRCLLRPARLWCRRSASRNRRHQQCNTCALPLCQQRRLLHSQARQFLLFHRHVPTVPQHPQSAGLRRRHSGSTSARCSGTLWSVASRYRRRTLANRPVSQRKHCSHMFRRPWWRRCRRVPRPHHCTRRRPVSAHSPRVVRVALSLRRLGPLVWSLRGRQRHRDLQRARQPLRHRELVTMQPWPQLPGKAPL